MSIVNAERIISHLKTWLIANYNVAGAPYIVIPLSGGINSSCAALISKKSNIATIAVHIVFDSESEHIVSGFCLENNIQLIKVSGSEIINGIECKVENIDQDKKFYIYKKYLINNFANMVSSSISNIFNGTMLSSFDKNKINFVRKINKISDAADLYLFGDLYASEVSQIFFHMTKNLPIEYYPFTKIISEKKLKDENFGWTISREELEWADRENLKSKIKNNLGILESADSPPNHPSRFWIGYNSRQRDIISKLNRLDKNIIDKNNNLNICRLRHIEGMAT